MSFLATGRPKEFGGGGRGRPIKGKKITRHLGYLSREGTGAIQEDGKRERAAIYDMNGERLVKEDYKNIRREIDEGKINYGNRFVISFQEKMTAEEAHEFGIKAVKEYKEKFGKNTENVYWCVHQNTENTHIHLMPVAGIREDVKIKLGGKDGQAMQYQERLNHIYAEKHGPEPCHEKGKINLVNLLPPGEHAEPKKGKQTGRYQVGPNPGKEEEEEAEK